MIGKYNFGADFQFYCSKRPIFTNPEYWQPSLGVGIFCRMLHFFSSLSVWQLVFRKNCRPSIETDYINYIQGRKQFQGHCTKCAISELRWLWSLGYCFSGVTTPWPQSFCQHILSFCQHITNSRPTVGNVSVTCR